MEIHVGCNGIPSKCLEGPSHIQGQEKKGNHDHHGTGKQTPTFSSQNKKKKFCPIIIQTWRLLACIKIKGRKKKNIQKNKCINSQCKISTNV